RPLARVDVDAILAPVAGVDEPIGAEHDTVRMAAVAGGELARPRADAAHLAQVVAVAVEDDHAVVAVAVRDVHAAPPAGAGIGVGIAGVVRGRVRRRAAGAGRVDVRAGPGPAGQIGPIAEELRADLQQHRLAVVRVLLDDAVVAVAADPEVPLVVD